jgi:hypothetical protein
MSSQFDYRAQVSSCATETRKNFGLCRVEERRGGVQGRRRLKQAASLVVAFAEPFPLAAHR